LARATATLSQALCGLVLPIVSREIRMLLGRGYIYDFGGYVCGALLTLCSLGTASTFLCDMLVAKD
jgi:predicted membrane protein